MRHDLLATRWEGHHLLVLRNDEVAERYTKWIGEPYPGAVTICSVACGGRWI